MSNNSTNPMDPNIGGFIYESQKQWEEQVKANPGLVASPSPPLFGQSRFMRQKTKASAKVRLAGVGLWLVGVLVLLGIYGANAKPHHSAASGIDSLIVICLFLITFVVKAWVRWMGRRQYMRSLGTKPTSVAPE